MLWFLISSLLMALAGGGVYLYYLYQGQFDDPEEDVKFQIFRDQEK